MPFSFSADGFVRIIDGARRVHAQAAAHERQMETLLAKTEADVAGAFSALAGLPEGPQVAIDPFVLALRAQLQRSQDGVGSVRRMWVAARESRLAASQLVSDLRDNTATEASSTEVAVGHAVLVVDDFADTRELVARVLEDAGFVVRTASNGLEAIIAAYEMRPAVIVMDVAMPILGGLEATRLIKTIDAIKDVRVIAHTAEPHLTDAALFAAVLEKPVLPTVVVDTVRRYATG
jgi:CheY-like chemotaxis protein